MGACACDCIPFLKEPVNVGKSKRFQVKNIDGKVLNVGFIFLVHEMKLFHQYHHNVMQGSGFKFYFIMQGIAIINTIGAMLFG